jgi:hypothetical protein
MKSTIGVSARWLDLDKAFALIEQELSDVARGITVEIWNGVLAKTPQYFGRMVASWTYSIGSPEFYDRSTEAAAMNMVPLQQFGPPKGLWRGHPDAVAIANTHSTGADKAFRLGDTVYISNGVNHGEGAYSQAIEDGLIYLRHMNRPGRPAQRTLDAAATRYAKGTTTARAHNLKQMTIGQTLSPGSKDQMRLR